MKYFLGIVFFIPAIVFAYGFYDLPYPQCDTMPQPQPQPQPQYYAPFLTPCSIPAGTYRFDAKNVATKIGIAIRKLVLKIHVNYGGMMVLTLQLKPGGREELYVVNPYGQTVDMNNICNGYYFSFWFKDINLYGKTLSGHITGDFFGSDRTGYLKVRGEVKRVDNSSWQSIVTIGLSNSHMNFVYPYTK
ncbi:hypothetical protein ACH42_14400 [Endozoicomonas sp. (ex Bugula neritina AB1)]|nr:hypothetical protein ACH42_14400 [Endozoicomonas sp. (ex Bugula neritina AB1)]